MRSTTTTASPVTRRAALPPKKNQHVHWSNAAWDSSRLRCRAQGKKIHVYIIKLSPIEFECRSVHPSCAQRTHQRWHDGNAPRPRRYDRSHGSSNIHPITQRLTSRRAPCSSTVSLAINQSGKGDRRNKFATSWVEMA